MKECPPGLCADRKKEYKYDSYVDGINYLLEADEIHREDVSPLVDSYFQKTNEADE